MFKIGDNVIATMDALPINIKNLHDINTCTIKQGTKTQVIKIGNEKNNTYAICLDADDTKNKIWMPQYWASAFQLVHDVTDVPVLYTF